MRERGGKTLEQLETQNYRGYTLHPVRDSEGTHWECVTEPYTADGVQFSPALICARTLQDMHIAIDYHIADMACDYLGSNNMCPGRPADQDDPDWYCTDPEWHAFLFR